MRLACTQAERWSSIGGSKGGGATGVAPRPLQISKIKGSNKTKQKKKKTILLKRKKRERVAYFSSFYVYMYTRWYVYQKTFYFQNFHPQLPPPLWKISGSTPGQVSHVWCMYKISKHVHDDSPNSPVKMWCVSFAKSEDFQFILSWCNFSLLGNLMMILN